MPSFKFARIKLLQYASMMYTFTVKVARLYVFHVVCI